LASDKKWLNICGDLDQEPSIIWTHLNSEERKKVLRVGLKFLNVF